MAHLLNLAFVAALLLSGCENSKLIEPESYRVFDEEKIEKTQAGSSNTGLEDPMNENPNDLITLVYSFPWQILEGSEDIPRENDPFKNEDLTNTPVGGRYSLKQNMEKAGMTFGEGASILVNSDREFVVRNTIDQHRLFEIFLDNIAKRSEKQIQIIFEMVEVDHTTFSDWLLSNYLDKDATVLRKAAQDWVRSGDGAILHTAIVMARSGQRAKVESVSEYTFPTEFDPPEIPNTLTIADKSEAPVTPVTGTAFETRNLGVTLEVDPVLGADNVTIDLNLAPEFVQLEGHTSWGKDASEAKLPTFHTQKITTQVTTLHGRYTFLGTTRPLETTTDGLKDPIVLNFVRADVSSVAGWSAEEVAE